MKKVGLVGGIGPASTLDYYSGIINGYRARICDDNYPEIVIDSINMNEMLTHVLYKDWNALVTMLLASITNLAYAGADFAAIASNTPHIVFSRVQAGSPLPLISIVEETCKYAHKANRKKVVVLGTRFTMSSGLYSEALKRYGITACVPSEDEQTIIHNIIFPKLEDGIVVPEDKRKMIAITERLLASQRADGLILGCTELPLMIKDEDLDTFTLNTTQIHIESIVNCI